MATEESDPEVDRLLAETADELFVAHAGIDALRDLPEGGWSPQLWERVCEIGLPLLGIDEEQGGAGGTLAHLALVAQAAGRHVAQIPLASHALAAWLLAEAGQAIPDGVLTCSLGGQEDGGSAWAQRVPYARYATAIVLVSGDRLALLSSDRCEISPGCNLAGEPADGVRADHGAVTWLPLAGGLEVAARRRAALVRSALTAGALQTVEALVLQHVRERRQFGVSLTRLPVVRERLALVAEEVAATCAAMAVGRLASSTGRGDSPSRRPRSAPHAPPGPLRASRTSCTVPSV